jgi:hypothetical protein
LKEIRLIKGVRFMYIELHIILNIVINSKLFQPKLKC